MNDLSLRFLSGVIWALLTLSRAIAADTSTMTPAQVYAIATVTVDLAQVSQYPKHLLAERAINDKNGVELVASYQIQFGDDSAREINIWTGADAESLRRALSAKELYTPELRQMIESEVVEIATRNPIDAVKPRSIGSSSTRKPMVFGLAIVTIDSASHDKFVEALRGEPPLEAKHGVNFVASYHIELGDTAREFDVWSAVDSETIRQSFYYGDAEAPGLEEVIKKEGVVIAASNVIEQVAK